MVAVVDIGVAVAEFAVAELIGFEEPVALLPPELGVLDLIAHVCSSLEIIAASV